VCVPNVAKQMHCPGMACTHAHMQTRYTGHLILWCVCRLDVHMSEGLETYCLL
jgi:hypothetical protein